MAKTKILLVLFTAMALLLSGCSLFDSGTDGKQSGISIGGGSSTKSGTGVSLEFAENNPPSEMFKGQPYNFAFVFKNYQEHDIQDLKLRLKGFDTGYVTGLQTDYTIQTLPKATTQAGPGVYPGHVVQGVRVDGFTGDYNFNPVFDYCYTAKTTFTQSVCVPSTMNQCDTDVTSSTEQNGPLSVKIDYINSFENNIRIDFSISNSGGGDVVNECFDIQDYANSYEINSVTLGTSTGNCQTVSETFEVIGDKANFYCEFPRGTNEDSYASQVVVDLEYLYQQETKKSIVVKDLTKGLN